MGSSNTPQITFVMAGCQRCGTTWVDAALREHPEIYLPSQKQTYFFDENYENGFNWYLKQFEACDEKHKAVGEIATGYCLSNAIPRMAKHLPHIKIIIAMRHPVDRAYSNYQVRKAVNRWSSFESALKQESDFLVRGQYIDQIELLLKYYPPDQIHYLFYDDLRSDDRKYLKSIFTFLGVDNTFDSSQIGRQRNASMFPRTRKALGTIGLKPLTTALSRSVIGDIVRKNNKKRRKPSSISLDPTTRAKLVEHFKPYNERLFKHLGRTLEQWNK
ncbi:MAG: sulfotransferase [Planctomycetota bacterium]|nr:sulfotransferase [Planctomycetota bacterium]